VELLKQPQYQPMPVSEQVLMIFAGTRGHLDDVPINDVQAWEGRFLQFIRDRKAEMLKTIVEAGKVDGELEAEIVAAIDEFKSIDISASTPVESETADASGSDEKETTEQEAAAGEDA
jgi:F-type H+-transporting ATPase subunit alpha